MQDSSISTYEHAQSGVLGMPTNSMQVSLYAGIEYAVSWCKALDIQFPSEAFSVLRSGFKHFSLLRYLSKIEVLNAAEGKEISCTYRERVYLLLSSAQLYTAS
jgi:hypothetical protein